jgi:hypothetical protein
MQYETNKQFNGVVNSTVAQFKSYFSILDERIQKDTLVI